MQPSAPPGGFLRGDTFLVLAAVALAQATFLADLFFPMGVAGGVPYVFVVLLGLRFTRLRSILLTATAVSLLIVAGAILPAPQAQGWSSIAPRLVTTFAVWGIALILIRHTRMHRALEAKRREARDYLDIVEVVIVALDEQGRVSLINRKGCEILGCDPGSIVGSDWFENHIPRRMRDQVRAVFRKIIAGTADVTEYFENPLLTRTGGERIIAWHNAPLKDTHGRIIGTLSSGEDVTDRRRNEERLRQQEALARLGQMAAVVAHEVRNPLAGISGAVEILQGRAPEGSADREILTTIRERIGILDQSVEDLLRFARPRNPHFVSVPVRELLHDTARLLTDDRKLSDLNVSISGPDVVIRCDADMIREVFLNLFLNAAHAMETRGRIDVQIEAEDGDCRVVVADDGPGISPAVRHRVFEPFFTTKTQGTGLGLPIARRLVELNGGEIGLALDAPGTGTTIEVRLPLSR